MKKAKWLIELDLFEDTELDLLQALKDSNHEVKTIQYIPMDDTLVSRLESQYEINDCVVFYGSLGFGRKFKKASWIPGVYLDEKKYACTSYYPVFGSNLVHQDFLMMPYGELMRRKERLFELFGDKLFLRPDSGFKEFTGMVLTEWNYDDGVQLAGFYNVTPDLLVLVSNAKPLLKEWRFVIVNQKVISGSLYRDWSYPEKLDIPSRNDYVLRNSHSVKELCTDTNAWKFAQDMAELYNPEPCWTMDVALVDCDESPMYELLEIGCFSCAGMYGNDLKIIVDEVSKAAEQEWLEYNDLDLLKI